jgi:hypothetical protein
VGRQSPPAAPLRPAYPSSVVIARHGRPWLEPVHVQTLCTT